MQLVPRTAALIAILAPLAAQEALVIKTSDDTFAERVRDFLGSQDELPARPEGHHFVFRLDDGGKATAKAIAGDGPKLDIVARPAELMEIWAEPLAELTPVWQGGTATVLAEFGIPVKESVRIFRGLMDFPKQVANLRIEVSQRDGMEMVHAEVDAVPGTWFDKLISSIEPDPKGPPKFDEGDARFAWAAKLPAAKELLRPFNEAMARISASSKDNTAKWIKLAEDLTDSLDGSLVAIFDVDPEDFDMSYETLVGLSDPDKAHKVYNEPEFFNWIKAMSRLDPEVEELEFEANAWEHRNTAIHQLTSFYADLELETFDAIAGSYLIETMGVSKDRMRELLDLVLDNKIARAPLGEGTLGLLEFEIDFEEGPPEGFAARLIKRDNKLIFATQMR